MKNKISCVLLSLFLMSGTGGYGDLSPVSHKKTEQQAFSYYFAPQSSGIPSGLISIVTSGICPAYWTEVTALNGVTLEGTLAANGDVGSTGGSDTVTPTLASSALTAAAQNFTGSSGTTSAVSAGTPAGTNSAPSLTMDPYTPGGSNSAPSISGSTATESSHTHSVTSNVSGTLTPGGTIAWPAGVPTNASGAFSEGAISWPASVPSQASSSFSGTPFTSVINHTHTITVTYDVQGGTTAATTGTHVMTSTATGGSARAPTSGDVVSATESNPSGGVSSITPAGSITNGAISWPAGVPTIASGTFTQPTVSWPAGVPAFTGTANQSVTMTNNAVTSAAGSAHSHGVGTLAASAPTFTGSQATLTGTVAAPAFTGNSLATHSHTLTPSGTNASSAVSGTITLNSLDNRPNFVKVIFCQKN